jgi:hypothetical protein
MLPHLAGVYQFGGANYGVFFAYNKYPNGGGLWIAIAMFNYVTGIVEVDQYSYQSNIVFSSGGVRVLALEASPVPVPAALLLLLAGIGAFGLMGRRRKSQSLRLLKFRGGAS